MNIYEDADFATAASRVGGGGSGVKIEKGVLGTVTRDDACTTAGGGGVMSTDDDQMRVVVRDQGGRETVVNTVPGPFGGGMGPGPDRPMTDAELIAALRRKPYDRAAREAADRLEELTKRG